MRSIDNWRALLAELQSDLVAARAGIRPLERGLTSIANDGLSPSLANKIADRLAAFGLREAAFDAVAAAALATDDALVALTLTGYPDLPPFLLDDGERNELLQDVANIDAVAASIVPPATGGTVSLSAGVDKP